MEQNVDVTVLIDFIRVNRIKVFFTLKMLVCSCIGITIVLNAKAHSLE